MTMAREKRIKSMQESMDRLAREYDVNEPAKKKKVAKKKKSSTTAPFSVFGLAAKIKKRKALNRKAAQD